MQQVLARAQRSNNRIALLFLDLDGFKPINDTLGHEAGDEALKEIARRLQGVVRKADTLARVGGDEFVLLAADLENPVGDRARTLATKCIDAVSKPMTLKGSVCNLGVSIGIAFSDGTCSADSLLAAADKAMYEAKQKGRGCYVMA
jgi:diguanylate cyclase (GGDEF)-like protein